MATPPTDNDGSTRRLCSYAANLEYDDLPDTVTAMARDCLIDAVACAVFGRHLPWSAIVFDTTPRPSGMAGIPGAASRTDAATAALLAGTFAHGFELDSLRKPGMGVHPGATIALPVLALAQQIGANGREVITAIVAGCEVMFRIGAAMKHSAEGQGFHAPGVTGALGSATACGRLLGLDAGSLENALGIAGSMTGGLMRFAAARRGGMIKRLHLGRAAQAGVTAALLARAGYEGPEAVLEGRFGVVQTFSGQFDLSALTCDLGHRFETSTICFKRYACHVTAQAPVQTLAELMARQRFTAQQIARIDMTVPTKIFDHHGGKRPADLALAQYSVPYMVAVSACLEIENPSVLTPAILVDPDIHDLVDRIQLVQDPERKGWSVSMTVTLDDGRVFTKEATTFTGAPDAPLSNEQMHRRFDLLSSRIPQDRRKRLWNSFNDLKNLKSLTDISFV